MEYRQIVGVSFCFVFTLLFTNYYYNDNILIQNWNDKSIVVTNDHHRTNVSLSKDKWIVITSISKPTQDIKKMAEISDWQIVIVADTKTPKDWEFKNCIFLSLELQQTLNYKIVTLLPYKSYTRKMIGYLYAIENGARYIYDTDDDNLPINIGLDLFDYSNYTSSFVRYSKTQLDNISKENPPQFYNVYSHYGRPDIWPRGFPLELINKDDETGYMLCRQLKTPIIQQGLVDKDADVDAIYRMIFVKNKVQGLNVHFDPFAPPIILGKHVYCPFNSQNTLFHYDAFWALLLPTTVAFRVTDIWRGYWAQRLLHLTGNHIGFYGPNARQTRNSHDYFKDYIDENQLYTDSTKFMKVVQQWKCSQVEFSSCILEMSMLLVRHKLWGMGDYKLSEAWIQDLKNIGYQFPAISPHSNLSTFDSCENAGFQSNMKQQSQIVNVKAENLMKLNDLCHKVRPGPFQLSGFNENVFNHTKSVVLVVIFNHPHFTHIPLLQTLYNAYFANVIFCGTFPDHLDNLTHSSPNFFKLWPNTNAFSYVNITREEMHAGYFGYICLNKIIDMKITNVSGYLVIADDMLLNFWNYFDNENLLLPVTSSVSCGNTDNWPWWNGEFGEIKLKILSKYLNETVSLNIDDNMLGNLKDILFDQIYCMSDIYYVPQKFERNYQALSQLFFDHKVFLEIAVPRIMYLLGWANTIAFDQLLTFNETEFLFSGTYWLSHVQGGDGAYPYYNQNHTFLHAVKLSELESSTKMLDKFCNIYINSFMNGINAVNKE